MISFFQFFTQKLRLSNPWRYKVPLLIAFCYFLLFAGDVHPFTAALSILAALGTTIGFMGFGYLTNDLADRKKDLLAGKPNGTTKLSSVSISLLVLTFLSIAILPWIYLPMDRISVICIITELVLFVLYAFPPFRLKERGFLGVITDSLYAHVVPGFLASWTFYLVGGEHYQNFFYFATSLSIWQLFSGIRNIISHHYKDYENDQASGTKTFATQIGKEKVYKLMSRVFIPLEVISVLVFLFVIQLEIDFLVIVLLVFLFVAWSNYRKGESETPAKHFTNTFLDRFYIHWFPYLILFSLAFGLLDFWGITLLHILIFHPSIGRVLRRFTEKKADSIAEEFNQAKIAILSTNRNQYSETFIQAHIRLLPNAVIYSDGYFPTSISTDRGETWKSLTESTNSKTALIDSWREHNVTSVLAEYGPAGVEVMDACSKANIRLIVHFHGFDAYRNDVLEFYADRYKVLFQKAAKIVVVSKDMHAQLLNLGCPEEKLEHITYGVDTDLFSPPNSDKKRHGFIACGRFVPKKSPLSTIRAFSKVVEIHPNAKLTFIGDGELLESAISLSKELKLEENIDFKGVLSPSEVSLEFKKHAIFVQHSVRTIQNDSEGTPLSLLEAAASGLAIVATKHAGISDVIEDEESGFLVKEGDVQKMSERMLELLEGDELRRQLGSKARSIVLKRYFQSDYISSLEWLLVEAEVPTQKESKLSIWKNRLMVFVVLFLIAEIGLRLVGYKSGVIEDFYFHRGEVQYDSLLYGDEVGITHVVAGAELILDGEINSEGFFSSIEFTQESMDAVRKSGKKIVMLIGDSYTQGCCADSYNGSYAQLMNQSDEYEVLNFGVPGADPVQYRLIVEKYAQIIKPDLIIVAVYGGNDILEYDRTPKPFVPIAYPIKDGPWLNSEGPIYLTEQGTYFKNFNEARAHYFEFFSLWSDDASFFERTIRYSVILSRPYLKWKTKRQYEKIKHQIPNIVKQEHSMRNLARLEHSADQINTLYTLIPSPSDVASKVNFREKYNFVFGELNYVVPSGLSIEDYDGLTDANHFNNQGHRKYAAYLATLIEAKLSE
ncbi:MAG: glycosyltransferase [Crocinitomicaceae bacterium]|nr:glycosyltransferase [Flavobacteriales bacterium]NQZ34598.1 glycosyltransferase [Crocinitomicaceae bacterium]